jgi:hypothetical protein
MVGGLGDMVGGLGDMVGPGMMGLGGNYSGLHTHIH